ncbi:maleylpyruvate isomerase family mycothiol-dependent enzyme [Nonomuraea sp. SBT364]|uniref:maleylpyruvate isomerase family mycothiol-dependent enzyme n=1 Tax=Nonomuraea sp. SBT364 TaxID=1580530 RepID=UPI00066B835B|nr:maleylpyruvate isomerase family mycothiol-dependent enzyme [Nonomuraea sp. SBT364]
MAETTAWLEAGTAYFAGRLAGADLDHDSALPGWTRRHVVAHVAANARALGRLVHWARTGDETPMYASRRARDDEIEELAKLAPAALTELAGRTAAELRDALAALPAPRWQARVRTAQGREVPATEIVWMRCREVWIHGVDLATGGTYDDFPPAMVDALLTDVTGLWERDGDPAGLTLAPDDRDTVWRAGSGAAEVRGSAAELAAWVTGRGPAPHGAPEIGRWL